MKNKLFVFDTNILLSALFNNESKPAQSLIKARSSGLLLISDEVATEYVSVFSRTKFDKYMPLGIRVEFIENIISNALPVIVATPVKLCRDPKDDKFLDLAIASNAHCIISGDDDLLSIHPFQGTQILNPSDFLDNF